MIPIHHHLKQLIFDGAGALIPYSKQPFNAHILPSQLWVKILKSNIENVIDTFE